MAIPTITGVSPGSGLVTGRNLVEITGTNFRLPPAPPLTGYVGGAEQITVSAQFEGVTAPFCAAASAEVILCTVPPWGGSYGLTFPLALDVRVANLDDAGAEIAGENATLADAYTIARPSLAAESFLQKHVRALLRYFRRYLLRNTHHTTSRDFVSDTSANERAKAVVPVVYLAGPRLPHNAVQDAMVVDAEDYSGDPPNGWIQRATPIVTDLEFDVYLITAGAGASRAILALTNALLLTLRDVPTLVVNADHIYQLLMPFEGFPITTTAANLSDLHIVQAVVAIKGVHVDHEDAIILERGRRIFDNDGLPTLDVQVGP